MQRQTFLTIISIMALISINACATPGVSTFKYTAPSPHIVDNKVVINKPFSEVWDGLVEELSKSFYVINNIDKDSRIINVSYSINEPQEYIDCGKSIRTYSRKKEYEEYIYNVAASSSFKIAYKVGNRGQFPVTQYIDRKTSLEGRINIYVAPVTNMSTKVLVNTRYIFSSEGSGTYVTESQYGQPIDSGIIPSKGAKLSFNTNQDNQANWGTTKEPLYIRCYSNGKLEGELLNMVK